MAADRAVSPRPTRRGGATLVLVGIALLVVGPGRSTLAQATPTDAGAEAAPATESPFKAVAPAPSVKPTSAPPTPAAPSSPTPTPEASPPPTPTTSSPTTSPPSPAAPAPAASAPAVPDSAASTPAAAPAYDPPWEFAPYRVIVWLAVESSPLTPGPWIAEQAAALPARWEAGWGAAVRPEVVPVTGTRAARLIRDLDRLTERDLYALDQGWLSRWTAGPAYDAGDKLLIVAVRPAADGGGAVEVRGREFDTHLRAFTGPPAVLVGEASQLVPLLLTVAARAFHPIARVERAADEVVEAEQDGRPVRRTTPVAVVRWRAGGLVVGDQPRLLPPPGTPLQPVIRTNDRTGRVRATGPDVVPWTYCLERSRDGVVSQCVLYSGMTAPMGGKPSRRTERYVYAVYPDGGPTDLVLRAQNADGTPGEPLVGYDVYARQPEGETTSLVGRTDWRGVCPVPPEGAAVRVLFVKHGGRLLAKLPTAPGVHEAVTAAVPRDDDRLAAEGAVRSLQNEFMDIVARRQVAIVRIKKMLDQDQVEEARKTFDASVRDLPTRDSLIHRLRELERTYVSDDPAQRVRIKALMASTHEALGKFLDPAEVFNLEQALVAKEGARPRSPSS